MRNIRILFILLGLSFLSCVEKEQNDVEDPEDQWWHDTEREEHYLPDGEDFVLQSGRRRFNRALYGTNSGFRVEAGDLPEFAVYMPGMGGNFKLGIIRGEESKWIIDCDSIATRYRPGSMLYTIKDGLLGDGALRLQILALADEEGFILKINPEEIPGDTGVLWAYGGASGKKFSRNGDIGADPESVFYLHPEYCKGNVYDIHENTFTLNYGSAYNKKDHQNDKAIFGVFPENSEIHLADAEQQDTPLSLKTSESTSLPVLTGTLRANNENDLYWVIKKGKDNNIRVKEDPAEKFRKAEEVRQKLAKRIKVRTPNSYINTLGGALAFAADAIWEAPAYRHGAVAWRMPLNGWRGAYVADPLGWHDRARTHFSGYANSQVIEPATGPVVADTLLNLARQKEEIGTSLFSRGYICRNPDENTRAHHYDMNLVFIDELLDHFLWTGDIAFLKEMWPVLQRHLEWEKRNFDTDGDGLYDAYASIWASDALQYNAGGVTHSSSYNYRANKTMAQLAGRIGKDPAPYKKEAQRIYDAMSKKLWMPELGRYAEYKDVMGNKLLHPFPGLWTVYHAMEAGVPDRFRAWQLLRYVDTEIPHIPIRANGLDKQDLYTLSTTSWQPYTWSVNNVAMAEVLHTALAYWQGGRPEEAFRLWESALVESMYLGASPGGLQQLSFYDAMRGELYRDFSDPVGMTGRTLVEGLFGIQPDGISDTLTVSPGFPAAWDHASLDVPDITFDYKRTENREQFTLVPRFSTKMHLKLRIRAMKDGVKSVTVNGRETDWTTDEQAVGAPAIEITAPEQSEYDITIEWKGGNLKKDYPDKDARPCVSTGGRPCTSTEQLVIDYHPAEILKIRDPQNILDNPSFSEGKLTSGIKDKSGEKSVFVKLKQGQFSWWQPLDLSVRPHVEIFGAESAENKEYKAITLRNNALKAIRARLVVNRGKGEYTEDIALPENSEKQFKIPYHYLVPGSNVVEVVSEEGRTVKKTIQEWNVKAPSAFKWETVDLAGLYNSKVTDIFKNEYLSPRPQSPTLQLPVQGIGNWCYPKVEVNINDSGLREKAGADNAITTPQHIPLATPGNREKDNIVFTSMWDNYPESVEIPLSGRAFQLYLIMAGSTNPMQSRLVNGVVTVTYTDGSVTELPLKNPENWWPVEQDYFIDNYAFTAGEVKPPRVYLKSGEITRNFDNYVPVKGFTDYGIDGGAATLLDIPLNPDKELKKMEIKTVANDVVIGLMSATLLRNKE
ncbi:DUF4450 domain-containing protein [Sinomicrobium kalidii]|uniref:DUF4450 domain-containing protein n=1 Tax=Sinomicrobium kalidii TaxID=2900738 RepID=UPI001E49BD20|nr:DUF4450 domain-containing protein [Sinomicrobium kalidii]UGU18203.1 DUF4450 domain-containing protein [Sinomicrobium kalidii]